MSMQGEKVNALERPPGPDAVTRVLSVDIFRGLTMLVMIFVNDLASVKGLPWWNYHMPRGANGMTYVDVVFPAFLFIVGMSIPLAISRRLAKGGSMLQLWRHILLRFASLAVLGIFIANWGKLDPQLAGVSKRVWSLTGFAGAILLWNVYPSSPGRQPLHKALRAAGFAMLFAMLAVFRRAGPDGQPAWLDFSYWEILGLIARAYLAACILYVPTRDRAWAPAAWLAALVALNVVSRLGWTPFLRHLPFWLWPFGRGDLVSITMAGIVASQIFLSPAGQSFRRRALLATAYAAALFAAGWALAGFGIAKLGGTPTWCLWSCAISVALFLPLFWTVDVKGMISWAGFVRPAGQNTLLTYLLPDIYYAAFGFTALAGRFGMGWPGAARSLVFTAAMLAVAAALTRMKIRLAL